jgi:YfiR/HmsC-like
MDVPVAVHLPVLLKVLSFDRQLRTRAPHEVVVGVVYQSGSRASVVAKDEAMQAFKAASTLVQDLPMRAIVIDLDHGTLADALEGRKLTHLYLTPLRATDVHALALLSREAHVITMTGVARYLDDGIGLGVGLRGGRLRILVNLDACRIAGADLSAEVLKLAELVP